MGEQCAVAKRTSSEEGTNLSPLTRVVRVDEVNAEQDRRMIEEAAYYLAEQRGFQGGEPLHD